MNFVGATLLFASLLQDPELADEVKADAIGFSVRPPAGWKQVDASAPALFKVVAGEKLAGASLLMLRLTPDEPYLVKTLGAKNIEYLKKTYPGCEIVKDEEVKVAGCKAHRVHARYKENTTWMLAIGRGPTEFYFVDLSCPLKHEEAAHALLGKVLATLRFYEAEPSKEEKEGGAAAAAVLKAAKLPASMVGESWSRINVAERVLGTIVTVVRDAKVAGRDGYEFESTTKLTDSEGGRRVETIKGSFLLDGSWQRQDGELMLESKALGTRSYRSIMTIEGGTCKATRTILNEADDTTFAVGATTYLDSVVDMVRSVLVMKGKGQYAMRVSTGFANVTAWELLETAEAQPMKIAGSERTVRLVLGKSSAFKNRTFVFEEDGRFVSVATPGVNIEIRRCTKEEYDKVKQP